MEIKGKKYAEVYIDTDTTIDDVQGLFAWNHSHDYGGKILDGTDHYVDIGGSIFQTITGDCFFDCLCINGFKVYKEITDDDPDIKSLQGR